MKDPKKHATSKCITGSDDDLPLIKDKINQLINERKQLGQELTLLQEKNITLAKAYGEGVERVNGWIKLDMSDRAQIQAGTMSEETYKTNWIDTGKWQALKKDRQKIQKLRERLLKSQGLYNKKRLRYNGIARTLKQVSLVLKNKKCAEMKSLLGI